MKILICVPVYNRKKMTSLILENIYKYKQDADLWVYNDWSDQYDNDFLEGFADKVFKLPPSIKTVVKNEKNINGMGVQHLRWNQFREVADSSYDAVYMTDNDALHDPMFIEYLKLFSDKYKSKNGMNIPICLYNTRWHNQKGNTIKETKDALIRKTAPGVSQLFSKQHCQKIVQCLDKEKKDPDYAWDYKVSQYLKMPFITSKNSFVEHFGADDESMHSQAGDWDRDRAVNPSVYLSNIRQSVIDYLEGRSEKPLL